MNKKCEICWEKPALLQCDNLLYLCKNCAISAGYNYQVYNLKDKSIYDDEDENNEEDDLFEEDKELEEDEEEEDDNEN